MTLLKYIIIDRIVFEVFSDWTSKDIWWQVLSTFELLITHNRTINNAPMGEWLILLEGRLFLPQHLNLNRVRLFGNLGFTVQMTNSTFNYCLSLSGAL